MPEISGPGREEETTVSMDTTIFCLAPDLVDEGVTAALSRIRDAGLSGLSVASVYHDGRDVTPHNPRRKVRFHEDGRAFFRPGASDFAANGIHPLISDQVSERGPFERIAEEATALGIPVQAWTVFLHNTSLGRANPHAVTRNVYGDPQFTSLCPANPAALEYCVSLAKSIVGTGVTTINAEGLHFLPLEHGYHHERYFLRIGPIDRLLLGLCFCEHCASQARTYGIDIEGFGSAVRSRLDRVFATSESFDAGADTIDALASLWDGQLVAFLTSREQSVTEALRQVAEAVHLAGGQLVFNDPAGALGRPASLPLPARLDRRGLRHAGRERPVQRGDAVRAEFAIRGEQGGRGSSRAREFSHLRPARADHELLEQLRAVPVSREADPVDAAERA